LQLVEQHAVLMKGKITQKQDISNWNQNLYIQLYICTAVCTGGNVKGYILVCLKIDDHNHLIKTEKNLDITFVNISNRETKLLRL